MPVTGSVKVMEIEIISKIVTFEMILRSKTPVCKRAKQDFEKITQEEEINR